MQKNAEPIREAVVNLQPHHTVEDLQKLAEVLSNRFKIDCFQIHIHKDEGLQQADGSRKLNHHAHMLFDWQDKDTGKTLKHSRIEFSQIQTVVAEVLEMERGEFKSNTNRERLEVVEYKVQQEELRRKNLEYQNQKLGSQNTELEQKKNELIDGNRWLRERIEAAKSRTPSFDRDALKSLLKDTSRQHTAEDFEPYSEEDVRWAISAIEKNVLSLEREIQSAKR